VQTSSARNHSANFAPTRALLTPNVKWPRGRFLRPAVLSIPSSISTYLCPPATVPAAPPRIPPPPAHCPMSVEQKQGSLLSRTLALSYWPSIDDIASNTDFRFLDCNIQYQSFAFPAPIPICGLIQPAPRASPSVLPEEGRIHTLLIGLGCFHRHGEMGFCGGALCTRVRPWDSFSEQSRSKTLEIRGSDCSRAHVSQG
jgi:hypothetical protein